MCRIVQSAHPGWADSLLGLGGEQANMWFLICVSCANLGVAVSCCAVLCRLSVACVVRHCVLCFSQVVVVVVNCFSSCVLGTRVRFDSCVFSFKKFPVRLPTAR